MVESSIAAPRNRSRLQSLQRAFEIVNILEQSNRAMTATELAQVSGMERTIIHRLLHTLRDEGVVEGGSAYTIGPRALTMSSAYLQHSPMHQVALPYLIDLLENTVSGRPWVVMLMIPFRERLVIIDRIWGADAPLNTILAIGTSLEFTHSAGGRSILAHLSPEEAAAHSGGAIDAELASELEKIRLGNGIALTHGDFPGIEGIAAPICTPLGKAVGAISISGRSLGEAFQPESSVGHQLRAAADAIGARS